MYWTLKYIQRLKYCLFPYLSSILEVIYLLPSHIKKKVFPFSWWQLVGKGESSCRNIDPCPASQIPRPQLWDPMVAKWLSEDWFTASESQQWAPASSLSSALSSWPWWRRTTTTWGASASVPTSASLTQPPQPQRQGGSISRTSRQSESLKIKRMIYFCFCHS